MANLNVYIIIINLTIKGDRMLYQCIMISYDFN